MSAVRLAGLLLAAGCALPAATGWEAAVQCRESHECLEGLLDDTPALSMLQRGLKTARSGELRSASGGKGSDADDWVLFPEGRVPYEQPGLFASENVYGPPDPNNAVGKMCAPHDTTWWTYNVTVPLMKPFIVSQDTPGRSDVAVIVLPGGGFDFLAEEKEGVDVAKWFNSIGISAFVLRYRVPERSPLQGQGDHWAATIDGQRAMKVLRSQAPQLGINPNRIGVIGFSAGGQLAQLITHKTQRMYPRIDDADDLSHRPDFQMLIYAAAAPLWPREIAAAPATFIAVAEDDQCTPPLSIMPYYLTLEVTGAPPSELHVYPSGRHGYGTCRLWVERAETFQDVCEWTVNARFFLSAQVFKAMSKEANHKLADVDMRTLLGSDTA